MQLTSYHNLTPNNIIFNDAKEYQVKTRNLNTNASKLKQFTQMVRKVI